MKRLLTAIVLAAPAVLLAGCSSCPICSDDSSAEVVACADCGVDKGAEACCAEEAELCGDCDEVKGSAECCK